MELFRGRLVADVPKGAEGFTVTYPDGRIVDLGTEFGVEVAEGGQSANFGVCRGEIEFHPQGDAARGVRLTENHAVTASNGNVESMPFDRDKFARRMPSREFAWELTPAATGPQTWDYDISHLVWTPGTYRVICKWMKGPPAGLRIESTELLLNGKQVSEDRHDGIAGEILNTKDNLYDLKLPSKAYLRGYWTLRLHVKGGASARTAGVVLVEEMKGPESTPADFIGTWEYLHNGYTYLRTFLPDGSARLTMDGQDHPLFHQSRWTVEKGILTLSVLTASGQEVREKHYLRDPRTLIFTNRPYRDATRAAP